MTRKPDGPLRKGWTTGACAAAAAKAAFEGLLTGQIPDRVTIRLPKGQLPEFPTVAADVAGGTAQCGVVKDAGDDPDVTHGATIIAAVEPGPAGSGITFRGGPGVGKITKPGLPLPPGEPAINPMPRQIIHDNLADLADRRDAPLDLIVTISVPGGEEIAKKTWNPRLGILGGISILGTTGIVVPFSCSAWIHSIHRGIDVARATGLTHVAGATGNASEAAVQKKFDLPDQALIDMGDFAGGMLKYLRAHPVPRVTIAGGFAKLVKLGQGKLDLHSSRSQVDFADLAKLVAAAGGGAALVGKVRKANTAAEVLTLAEGLPLAELVAHRARSVALATLGGGAIDILVVDRNGVELAFTARE
ncbi:cobalt-precorrin-5B (C(1))-methyltransferase [Hwanghaeella grinnelliae]|uniref:cobalt-precorrin-5B (C(1))-methyltransferase n=1 Tax=Hwanghaeella grinnelliae TaxID=2500179 RepID=UPI001F0024A6|nr:cobalt-precorrin-5B (C(1))-methyltransferase [Hwanghaeella grinnelliae]